MKKRTYISQSELDRFLNYLKVSGKWNYYIIIHNLVIQQIPYVKLRKLPMSKLLIPEDCPIPTENPCSLIIRTINKQLKIYQAKCGIRDANFTTKLFSRRFTVKGEIFYGVLEENKITYKNESEGYVYIIKHSHRNPEISKLLTDKKIGISHDYLKRIGSLTLGTVGVEIIKVWKVSSSIIRFIENMLHTTFRERNLVGEWFSDEDDKLVGMVEEMISSFVPHEVKE